MAHLASLLMVPVEAVFSAQTRESLFSSAAHGSHCSHFIASHPIIRPILDVGVPLKSEMWHPIAKPHYRLPADLRPIVATLRDLEETDEQIKSDSWVLGEVRRLREACEFAVAHELALLVLLSNTLSRPPMPRKR
jgi:hypothetical protein